MKSVLLVDDGLYAADVAEGLAGELGIEACHEADPGQAAGLVGSFSVVVVDVLFRPVTEAFESARRAGGVHADRGPFLVSGLAVLQAALDAKVPAVIWTDGGDDRLLHMRYAYEELRTRVFCRKDEAGLATAVRTAYSGGEVIPRDLAEEGLHRGANKVADSLFRRPHWAKIWRLLAIGEASTHNDLARAAKGRFPYARRDPGEMATEAANMHAFTVPKANLLQDCHRFASKNALFLLDATIHERHP